MPDKNSRPRIGFRQKCLLLQKAVSTAYGQTFAGASVQALLISILGVFKSLFELLGTAFSMQAIVSTMAEGRALRLGNAISERLGYEYRFDGFTIMIVVVGVMVVAYTLSILFSECREYVFSEFSKRKRAEHTENLSDGMPFSVIEYKREIRTAEVLTKLFEAVIFAFLLLVFLTWISLTFALMFGTVLSAYFLIILYNQKNDLEMEAGRKRASSGVRKKAGAEDLSMVTQFFDFQNTYRKYKNKRSLFFQVYYMLSITVTVIFCAVNFEPGQIIVIPLLIILSIRKLLGLVKDVAMKTAIILEFRAKVSL